MYSIRELLKQEPNTIREFVLLVLAVFVMAGLVHLDARLVAGIGLVVSNGLGLFYVRQASVSKSSLSDLANVTTPAAAVTITTGDKVIAQKTVRKKPKAKP